MTHPLSTTFLGSGQLQISNGHKVLPKLSFIIKKQITTPSKNWTNCFECNSSMNNKIVYVILI